MSSLNAERVATVISENIRRGKKIVLGEIIRKSGYSYETSLKPKLVTTTDSFRNIMKPLADKLKDEINRIADELSRKDLSKERYETLAIAFDKLNKNYQLATGGVTENTKTTIEISETIAKKYNLNNDTTPSTEPDSSRHS